MTDQHPIIVVGSPRSGTTWVGDVLSADPDIHQNYEPFNRVSEQPLGGHRWPFQTAIVPYASATEPAPNYLAATSRLINQRIPASYFGRPLAGTLLSGHRSIGEWAAPVGEAVSHHLHRQRLLIKDPLATLMLPWLVANFNMRAIYIYRHPGGVVAGVKRMGWGFLTGALLANDQMMADLLEPVRPELEIAASHPDDVIEGGIARWIAFTWPIIRFAESIDGLIPLSYEATAHSPVEQFSSVADQLGLRHVDRVQARASETSSGPTFDPTSDKQHVLKRDSSRSVSAWRNRLTPGEIDHVLDRTSRVRDELKAAGFGVGE